jgi:hypothetical protein
MRVLQRLFGRPKPDGIYGHWAKQMIEDGLELEDDVDDIDEDLDDIIEYDFGVYEDEQEETE